MVTSTFVFLTNKDELNVYNGIEDSNFIKIKLKYKILEKWKPCAKD